eukprot:TRINITY_DN16567_c0_g1_i1.p1 TRINITY_DN16567_c0_g1~~TRINITY_DN16567_c0_g1_i1.p1  ORF type:complete len:181 (-),score=44.33 TRINITY_DN16567_c0_g1_i1:396-938(-)
MSPEAAMEEYVRVLEENFPDWKNNLERGKAYYSSSLQQEAQSREVHSVFNSDYEHEKSDDEMKLEPIFSYARDGDIEGLLQTLKEGSSVNLKDGKCRTPLHWAVGRGHVKIFQMFVSEGADVNAKDIDGQTPLHYAMMDETEGVAKYLTENGADPLIKDNGGVSPKSICSKSSNWLSNQG